MKKRRPFAGRPFLASLTEAFLTGLEAVADARTAELFDHYCEGLRSQAPRKKRAARAAKPPRKPPAPSSVYLDTTPPAPPVELEQLEQPIEIVEQLEIIAPPLEQLAPPAPPPLELEQLESDPALVVTLARSRASRTEDGRMRGVTIGGRLTRAERRASALVIYPDVDRPATRGECHQSPGPCPFVSCKWHLYLEVNEATGAIKFNFPDKDVDELEQTCALDVADRGPHHREAVGALINATRERVRQIEAVALAGGRESAAAFGVHADD